LKNGAGCDHAAFAPILGKPGEALLEGAVWTAGEIFLGAVSDDPEQQRAAHALWHGPLE
jgi:hypothetical protein